MTISLLKEKEISDFVKLYMKFIDYLRYNCGEIYFDYSDDIQEKLKTYFEKSIKDPLFVIYLAKENDTTIGFIAGDMRPSFFPYSTLGLNGYISGVYVEENTRKKGITKLLENYITEIFFKKHNATFIELHCLTNNIVAKKMWEALGYKTFREQLRKKIK